MPRALPLLLVALALSACGSDPVPELPDTGPSSPRDGGFPDLGFVGGADARPPDSGSDAPDGGAPGDAGLDAGVGDDGGATADGGGAGDTGEVGDAGAGLGDGGGVGDGGLPGPDGGGVGDAGLGPDAAVDAGGSAPDAATPDAGRDAGTADAGPADAGQGPPTLTLRPGFVSLALGSTLGLELDAMAGAMPVWSVDGVVNGDATLGRITQAGDPRRVVFEAPRQVGSLPVSRVVVAAVGPDYGRAILNLVAPAPRIDAVTPTSADLGAASPVSVVITGEAFSPTSLVELDGVSVPVVSRAWDRIEATLPPSLLTTPGERRLIVRTPPPGGGSAAIGFPVVLRRAILGPGVAAGVPTAFDAAMPGTDAARQPRITYPQTGAIAPLDFPAPRVSWTQPAPSNVCRIEVRAPAVAIDAYVTTANGLPANTNPNVELDSAIWAEVVATTVGDLAAEITVTCAEVVNGTIPNATRYTSPTVTYHVPRLSAGGRVVYFSGLIEGLWRIDIGGNRAAAEPFIGPDPAFRLQTPSCIGCHSFSGDGLRMSYAENVGTWSLGIAGISTSTPTIVRPPTAGGEAVWTAMHPAGRWILATDLLARVTLMDGNTGQTVMAVPTAMTGAETTQAVWSPQGDRVAFVAGVQGLEGVTDFSNGVIWTMSFSEVGGQPQFGPPQRLVGPDVVGGTAYYPSFSPDGLYVVFCRAATGSSYNNRGATLWMIRADGVGGPVRLDRANMGANLYNSWPRWAPTITGGRYWLLFSSQRPYPPLRNTGPQQLWVTQIDPSVMGDPSSPAIWLSGQEPFTGNLTAEWTISR